jgi:hypothetical protein
LERTDVKTVPLHGKMAAGRVALVDDGDYELVMQYRWRVLQQSRGPGRKTSGPYAIASLPRPGDGSREKAVFMHVLIMGFTGIDHANGNGLDNQRSNLRAATGSQNKANNGRYFGSSGFKGVYWRERDKRWHAQIRVGGKGITIGYFHDEVVAARAYDDAAREAFGEFARTNFEDIPTPAMQAQWQAEREAFIAGQRRAHSVLMSEIGRNRQSETRICAGCGAEYQTKALNGLYCGAACKRRTYYQQKRDRQQDGRLF